MSSIAFDTLKYTKQLEEAGVPRIQAEAQTAAYKQSITEIMVDFASKEEVNSIRKDVDTYRSDIITIKSDIVTLKTDVAMLKGGMAILITLNIAIVGILLKIFFN